MEFSFIIIYTLLIINNYSLGVIFSKEIFDTRFLILSKEMQRNLLHTLYVLNYKIIDYILRKIYEVDQPDF